MSGSIEMENTYTPEQEVGVVQWVLGKSVSSVLLRNTGLNDGFVGIAAPSLARILPVNDPLACHDFLLYYYLLLSVMLTTHSGLILICFVSLREKVDLAMFGGDILCQV